MNTLAPRCPAQWFCNGTSQGSASAKAILGDPTKPNAMCPYVAMDTNEDKVTLVGCVFFVCVTVCVCAHMCVRVCVPNRYSLVTLHLVMHRIQLPAPLHLACPSNVHDLELFFWFAGGVHCASAGCVSMGVLLLDMGMCVCVCK